MSDVSHRTAVHQGAIVAATVAMVACGLTLLGVLISGAQVETPLALSAALLVLAAGRHALVRDHD